MIIKLKKEKEDSSHFFNTFTTQNLKNFVHTFMLFNVGKSGVFIGPNNFKNGAKKYLILYFRGTSDTTTSTG